MILAIDMGNTNIVVGAIDEDKVYFLERLRTDTLKTSLEYAVILKNLLEFNGMSSAVFEGAILSSVVPQANKAVTDAVRKVTGLTCMTVRYDMNLGLKIGIDIPSQLGSDIIVTSVACASRYQLPLAVIDMGTATTIFVVDKNRVIRGGLIHPGIKVSLETLSSHASLLPHIELSAKPPVIGTNTNDSMTSGILYGHAGLIDGCLHYMEEELGEPLTAIATGGLAPTVTALCRHKVISDPELLLKGLLDIYRMNLK